MRLISAFALLCLTFTANAFYIFSTSQSDLNILLNAQSNTDASNDFNEITALGHLLTGFIKASGAAFVGDSLKCLTGDGPITLFEYYYGLFLAAGTSGQTSALDATRNYLNSIGARRLKKLPAEFTQCLKNSQDLKNLQEKWKVDLSSDAFANAFSSFATSNPSSFQTTFSDIYEAVVKGDFYLAGALYGSYAKVASLRARTK